MTDSIDPKDFRSFTRGQAIGAMVDLDDSNDLLPEEMQDYTAMDNEELEGELCSAGIVHDTDMKGVFNTQQEADTALYTARLGYNE